MAFPHFSQLEFSDCGPTCLRIIIRHYGKKCDLSYLRNLCEMTRAGISLKDIARMAEKLGFATLGISATIKGLDENKVLPCILHWRGEHFLVLYKITSKYYYLSDPAHGKVKIAREEFLKLWKDEDQTRGIALFLEPTDSFYFNEFPYTSLWKQHERNWRYYKENLKGYYHYVCFIILLLGASSLLGYVFPKTLQTLVDRGMQDKHLSVLWSIICFQLALVIGQLILHFLQGWVRIQLSMHVGIRMIKELLFKLIRLPIRFFDSKMTADLYQRIDDQSRVEKFLSDHLLQTFFSTILALTLITLLMQYDFYVGLGFLFLSLLSLVWTISFNKRRRQLDYSNFHLSTKNRNLLHEILEGMVEIKMNNAQHKKVNQWINVQEKIYNLRIRTLQVGVLQSSGVQMANQLKGIGATALCAYLVAINQMSFGEMISVGYIIGMLGQPLEEFVSFTQTLQEAQLSMERLDIIRERPDENVGLKTIPSNDFKKGFFLDNISFKYDGSFSPNVIKDFSAFIEKGKVTAIVGESGSGKTTLLKLLLNFYAPQKGTIYLDNNPLNSFNSDLWREQCGCVMQDGYLFSGTIADNITIFEENPPYEKLKRACEIACIWEFINKLPLKLRTKVGSIGSGISGGQRQRLLIARAVYKDPEFLFFDEATSSLDASNEREIIRNLQEFFKGKTVIIVAHRLSTVRNADKIIVMDKGTICEQGNHTLLTHEKGKYYRLIKNQLELSQ